MQINLKPLSERAVHGTDVIRRLGPRLAEVPGIRLYMQPVQDLTVDDRVSRTQYQYTLEDPNPEELNAVVQKLLPKLQARPELADVVTDQQLDGLASALTIDRPTASRFGITPATIDNTLYDAFGQRQINTLYTQVNQYHVILEADPKFQRNPGDLHDLYIQSTQTGTVSAVASGTAGSSSGAGAGGGAVAANSLLTPAAATNGGSLLTAVPSILGNTSSTATVATPVPLSAFMHIRTHSEPLSINHQGQFPVVTVSFNLGVGYSLGQALDAFNEVVSAIELPPGVIADYQGTAAAYASSQSNEGLLILAALITVYIVLGVLYESFIHPVTILSTLPSAGVGALLALRLFGLDLDIVGIIGIILLIGIVQKNGIMMVDFALELERKEHKETTEAIYQAALLRFRPILMTTLAALLSGVPLAFGSGIGSELRKPLGVAMVGGLLFSQMLTLYTTPVIYIFFDRLAARFSRRRRAEMDRAQLRGGAA
jgi:multidrug efflux pump